MLEIDQRPSIRLHIKGCCNGDMWVNTGFPAPQVMLLRRGWKTFECAHCLMYGHVLCFKLAKSGLLSVKVFGDFGTRLKCCVESSSDEDSDDGSSSSSESDEEDGGQMMGTSPTRRRTPRAWAGAAAAASAPGRSSGRGLQGAGPAP